MARLTARLDGGLGGSARLKYGACVAQSSSSFGHVGCGYNTELLGDAYGLPMSSMKLIFAPVSLYG